MNSSRIVKELKEKYPGKNIVLLPQENPTEIICEIEPTSKHPEYSKAIAVIEKSDPHFHKKSTEKYTILKGKLKITKNGKEYRISEGETFLIKPMDVHFAEGDSVWAEVISTPGWTLQDHILSEK